MAAAVAVIRYAFDPSIDRSDGLLAPGVHFQRVGLGAADGSRHVGDQVRGVDKELPHARMHACPSMNSMTGAHAQCILMHKLTLFADISLLECVHPANTHSAVERICI